jgi:hypothetical protein
MPAANINLLDEPFSTGTSTFNSITSQSSQQIDTTRKESGRNFSEVNFTNDLGSSLAFGRTNSTSSVISETNLSTFGQAIKALKILVLP